MASTIVSNDNGLINKTLFITSITTPIGKMTGCASEKGIVMLLFQKEADQFLEDIRLNKKWDCCIRKSELLLNLESQVENYFNGTLLNFDIQIDPEGTLFQRQIWEIVRKISYGSTKTYKDLAIGLGNIKTIRAVAGANAHNSILLLIPCHRVLGTGNKLTGYRGGVEKKRWLIEHERTTMSNHSNDKLF
jgi:AraC family transcriptional regulator, regulatory protein of adaptative response / methylated-DNA-[protein]-cysteine methyltransferase